VDQCHAGLVHGQPQVGDRLDGRNPRARPDRRRAPARSAPATTVPDRRSRAHVAPARPRTDDQQRHPTAPHASLRRAPRPDGDPTRPRQARFNPQRRAPNPSDPSGAPRARFLRQDRTTAADSVRHGGEGTLGLFGRPCGGGGLTGALAPQCQGQERARPGGQRDEEEQVAVRGGQHGGRQVPVQCRRPGRSLRAGGRGAQDVPRPSAAPGRPSAGPAAGRPARSGRQARGLRGDLPDPLLIALALLVLVRRHRGQPRGDHRPSWKGRARARARSSRRIRFSRVMSAVDVAQQIGCRSRRPAARRWPAVGGRSCRRAARRSVRPNPIAMACGRQQQAGVERLFPLALLQEDRAGRTRVRAGLIMITARMTCAVGVNDRLASTRRLSSGCATCSSTTTNSARLSTPKVSSISTLVAGPSPVLAFLAGQQDRGEAERHGEEPEDIEPARRGGRNLRNDEDRGDGAEHPRPEG